MSEICIPVPDMRQQKMIEVEVKVDGVKKRYNYRVEIFSFDNVVMSTEERISFMKEKISQYDDNWQLYQIGMPTESYIPIMFRQKN